MEQTPKAPFTRGDTTLEIDPVVEYGYMTVTIDMSSATKRMTIVFNSPKLGRNLDRVTVDLLKHKIVSAKIPRQKKATQHSVKAIRQSFNRR